MFEELSKMKVGACLGFRGMLVESQGSKQDIEMLIKVNSGCEIKIYGDCPADTYPLAKKAHSNEVIYIHIYVYIYIVPKRECAFKIKDSDLCFSNAYKKCPYILHALFFQHKGIFEHPHSHTFI